MAKIKVNANGITDGTITATNIADSTITSAKILDGTIANADIANSTINLTTKVTGVLPVANGGTGLTALGTANQVLAVNSGATALEYQAVSSDYVLLATTTASNSASVSFDGYFSATYKNYFIIFSNILPATNSTEFRIRFRRSNADITAGNYTGGSGGYYINSSAVYNVTDAGATYNQTYLRMTGSDVSNLTARGGIQGNIYIYDPLETSAYKRISATHNFWDNGGINFYIYDYAGSLTDATSALSGITFYWSSGNITSGTFKLYGIK